MPPKDVVYNCCHDDTLKQAVRAGKTPEDAMELGSLKLAMSALDDVFAGDGKQKAEDEKRALNSAAGDTADVDTSEKLAELMEQSATDVMLVKIKAVTPIVSDEDTTRLKDAEDKATRLVNANTGVEPIPESEKKAREMLLNSAAGKVRGKEGRQFVAIIIDQGLFGEPITSPHIRINAVNSTIVKAPQEKASDKVDKRILPLARCLKSLKHTHGLRPSARTHQTKTTHPVTRPHPTDLYPSRLRRESGLAKGPRRPYEANNRNSRIQMPPSPRTGTEEHSGRLTPHKTAENQHACFPGPGPDNVSRPSLVLSCDRCS